jgi:hypothetical protein
MPLLDFNTSAMSNVSNHSVLSSIAFEKYLVYSRDFFFYEFICKCNPFSANHIAFLRIQMTEVRWHLSPIFVQLKGTVA